MGVLGAKYCQGPSGIDAEVKTQKELFKQKKFDLGGPNDLEGLTGSWRGEGAAQSGTVRDPRCGQKESFKPKTNLILTASRLLKGPGGQTLSGTIRDQR